MIFVTLGSQKFPFNRLLKRVDALIEEGIIQDEVFAQTGVSDYIPQHYAYKTFLDRDEFAAMTDKCDVFITHGGTGAIIGALKKGKKVIAVPRLAKYGEHVDDHQLQLIEQFEELGSIAACYDLENLGEAYEQVQWMEVAPYYSNTERIIESIELFLKEKVRERDKK